MSLPAPVSSTATPAVACGTHTFSNPSSASDSARNRAQAPLRSTTDSAEPVRMSSNVVFMAVQGRLWWAVTAPAQHASGHRAQRSR